MNNPYIVDRPLTEQDLFFGRETYFDCLSEELNRGARLILLYGKRHAGKTSFLNQLPLHLNTRYRVQRLDPLPLIEQSADVLWAIVVGLAQVLEGAPPDKARYEANSATYMATFLQTIAPASDGVVVVCVDALPPSALSAERGWPQALAVLGVALERATGLILILAIGGHPAQLGGEDSSGGLPQIVLGPLRMEETEDLLTIPVRGVLAFDYEAIRRIHHLAGGSPFFVQAFGRVLFERRAAAGWVGLPEVEHAIERAVAFGAPLFEASWQASTPRARVVLCAFAEMMGYHGVGLARDLAAFLARLGVQMSVEDIDSALAELAQQDVLERLGGETYRFGNDLFRYWLKRNRNAADIVRQARRYRRARVRPVAPPRQRRVDWLGVLLWLVAGVLVLLIAAVWGARQKGIVWTVESTPVPTARAGAAPPTATSIPPTPDTGVALGRIVYMAREGAEDKWQIYAMRSDGSDPVRLTNSRGNDTFPVWSPDGRRIAFVSDRDGNREIYVMNADGNEQLNLTENGAEDWTPAWSPDGKRIAFASFRDRNWEIYVMNADGSKLQRLTTHSASDYGPTWSPDGRMIAFESNREGNLEIYLMAAEGSSQHRFTSHPATDQMPAWSADGQQVFWESYRDGNMEIYMANLDGSDLRNVTNDPQANDHGPAPAPKGRRIAYYSNRDGGWDIYTLDVDTRERVNLTMSQMLEQAPNWGR